MRSACERKLVPNWISWPSAVRPGGRAMMPALQIRMSSLVRRARMRFAGAWMEDREARSVAMNVEVVVGNWE
jgi:hypothetical protein